MDRHNVMFSQKCPFPWLWGYEPPSNSLQSTSNRHLDRFSRVCTRVPNTQTYRPQATTFLFFFLEQRTNFLSCSLQGCICREIGGVEPPAKISDPLLLLKNARGVDFLCTYALARSSTSTLLMKFDKYSPGSLLFPSLSFALLPCLLK